MDMENSKNPSSGKGNAGLRSSGAANISSGEPKPSGKKLPAQKRKSAQATPLPAPIPVAGAQWHQMICEAAYFRAEKRGFSPGHALDDWLMAESEIKRMHSF